MPRGIYERTEEACKRISDGHKGEKHWNWKGGISRNKKYYHKNYSPKGSKNYKRKLYLNMQRRSRKLNANGSHTLAEWETLKAQYNWTCPACKKKESETTLSEDHIVPLSKGGSNNIENIQPLCRSCNSKKHTKIVKYEIQNL